MAYPVLTPAEMRAWEASTWESGVSPESVIDRVGRLLAAEISTRTRPGDRIVIVAGPGNNGADAKSCARHLSGRQTVLIEVSDPESATAQLQDELLEPAALVLDGIFGIGLNRPVEGAWADLLSTFDRFRGFRVAIDIPSGIHAESGNPMGTAVHVDETWTLGAPKLGLVQPPAASFTGRVRLLPEIGLRGRPKSGSGLLWATAGDFEEFPPRRPVDGHKGTFGHTTLLVGSQGYHGAAVLASVGSLAARPGLTTTIVLPEVLAVVAAQLSAPMVRSWQATSKLPDSTTSVVMGPGLGAKEIPVPFRDLATRLWRDHVGPVVADASALDWLPPRSGPAAALRVVTPHPGEAARMLDCLTKDVLSDRVGAVRQISRRLGSAWVVLKGYQTLVGRADGPIWVNTSGNPGMAQGGTGDVLAGFLGGLLAQPRLSAIPERTIAYAVWEHGAAADRLEGRRRNWNSRDLADEIGA